MEYFASILESFHNFVSKNHYWTLSYPAFYDSKGLGSVGCGGLAIGLLCGFHLGLVTACTSIFCFYESNHEINKMVFVVVSKLLFIS